MANHFVCSASGGGGTSTYDGTTWYKSARSITELLTNAAVAGGDVVYVHKTHDNNAGGAITWAALPETGALCSIICVDGGDAAFTTGGSAMGTTVGSITTGAIERTNSNAALSINANNQTSSVYFHGITFKVGSGGSEGAADILIATNQMGQYVFEACSFVINSTQSGSLITIGSGQAALLFEFSNCDFQFGATGQYISISSGRFIFRNCTTSGATAPTTLLKPTGTSTRPVILEIDGCDFDAPTYVFDQSVAGHMGALRANSSAIGTPTTGANIGYSGWVCEFHACAPVDGTNGADILNYYWEGYVGIVQDDQTAYLTTGSATGEQDDGTDTPYSLLMQPSTAVSIATPLYTPWIYALVGSTGAKTITMKAADLGADADELHNSELWLEVEYMGEPGATGTQRIANSPHAVIEVDDDCPVMSSSISRDVTAAGTDRTDTDEAWTGIAETNTYTLTASVTCDEVGYIRCRVGLAFDRDVYVDPKIGVA